MRYSVAAMQQLATLSHAHSVRKASRRREGRTTVVANLNDAIDACRALFGRLWSYDIGIWDWECI